MNCINPLSDFFTAIENDYRISPMHIAVYAALLQYRSAKGFINPIMVFSCEITAIAKISSPNTYHKCVQELHQYGYIKYKPSFKKTRGSEVYFLFSAQ
ncbi:hypothetical protein NLG42_21290 [Flavobacterium plurextorum]|nr:hypothetical protein NLG42_21290 [Flavobacterium plurextorum]